MDATMRVERMEQAMKEVKEILEHMKELEQVGKKTRDLAAYSAEKHGYAEAMSCILMEADAYYERRDAENAVMFAANRKEISVRSA